MSINEGQMLGGQPLHEMCTKKEALPLSRGGGPGFGVGTVSSSTAQVPTLSLLMHTRYLRELEEHISRSGNPGRHGPPAPLDHSPLGGTLFTGDENVDIPPTPQASSTLLDNQADIGWRSMSIGMMYSFSVCVFAFGVLIVVCFQGLQPPCILHGPLKESMRQKVAQNKTITDQDSLRILWLTGIHHLPRHQMVDSVSV